MSAQYIRSGVNELTEFIQCVFSVECGGCGNVATALTTSSAITAAREFHRDGWRVEDDELKCPECAGTQFEQGGK